MSIIRLRVILMSIALLASSCASAELTVAVDVFDGDPAFEAALTPDRLNRTVAAIRDARTLAAEVTDARTAIAKRFVEFYPLFSDPDADVTAALRELNADEYEVSLLAMRETAVDLARQAETALVSVANAAAHHRTTDGSSAAEITSARVTLNAKLAAFEAAVQALGKPLDATVHFQSVLDEFSKTESGLATDFVNQLALEMERAAKSNDPAERGRLQQARDALDRLVRAVEDAAQAGLRAQAFGLRDNPADDSGSGPPNSDSRTFDVARTIQVAASVGAGTGFGEKGRAVLRQLAASLAYYESQVDRLQDPADPAWRIVSDPEMEGRWHPNITHAHTRAEGNTSTVIVRDRVGRFRVQRVNNNPTALIEGQARITRKITSGVVGILAAAGGIPLDKIRGEDGKPIGPPTGDDEAADPLALAQESMRVSSALRRGLLSELKRARAELSDLAPDGDDSAAWDERVSRLRALVERYGELFELEAEQ